ncbi:MAG: hypothetical protein LC104_15965 [Bacteroidales bacterium]|nr:hypothetical protein [Bacteroidales bacterium]
MTNYNLIREFLQTHGASPVGSTPPRPTIPPDAENPEPPTTLNLTVERDPTDWQPIPLGETPAQPGEFPERFIDGSHMGQPVLCIRSPQGYPIPLLLAEVGAVVMKLTGRRFERSFAIVERVLGFVAEPFAWETVEAFTSALANVPEFALRVLPARLPDPQVGSVFDYEAMREQAYNRCQNEMLKLEVLALDSVADAPTLVDGQVGGRIGEQAAAVRPLIVGSVKSPRPPALHPQGHQTMLALKPGQRTPYYRDQRTSDVPLASWFLRLAGGPRTAPNWGIVRIDVPWVQLTRYPPGFVDRLSRWIVDARCRVDSYARMPVSLDPIVRAEDALKPLFTPLPVLVNRLYRAAGLFRENAL